MKRTSTNGRTDKMITFLSADFRLKGTLHLPDKNNPPVVIGSHGLLSSSSSPKQMALARECVRHGIAFFRFDHRGCGSSDGTSKDVMSFNGRCNDMASAIRTVKAMAGIGDQIGLFGSSMGGSVSLSTASAFDTHAMVTFAAPIRSSAIFEMLKKSADSDMPRPLLFEKEFTFDLSDNLSKIHNILIFHGKEDNVVPVSHALEIYEKAGESKKLILQEEGDHRMSNRKHQLQFVTEAAQWFKSCFA